MQIFDALDDINLTIAAVIQNEQDCPMFVKQASVEFGEAARDNKEVWAWPEQKRFPLDTPNDIFWSHHYFKKTASYLPNNFVRQKVASAIASAVKITGVPVEFAKQITPASIPNESFALRLKAASCSEHLATQYKDFIRNGEICMYPLHTEDQVKMANANFPKGLDDSFEPLRPMVASAIAEKTASYLLNPAVRDYLPMSFEQAAHELQSRAGLFPKQASLYNKAVDILAPDMDKLQFAMTIDALDKQSGADKQYGRFFKSASVFLRGIENTSFPDHGALDKIVVKGASFPISVLEKVEDEFPDLSKSASAQEDIDSMHPSVVNLLYSMLMS